MEWCKAKEARLPSSRTPDGAANWLARELESSGLALRYRRRHGHMAVEKLEGCIVVIHSEHMKVQKNNKIHFHDVKFRMWTNA
uniref:Uncharacterized protein n=1 Tax=Oryza punctata TaxID=4537 RepID=A0A0E0LEC2_ORYPU